MKSIFQEAPPLIPIDRVARRVFGDGEHWEPPMTRNAQPFVRTWDNPPECNPLPSHAHDYSGIRRGRMVAFRYFESQKWLCRCDCGAYEIRRIKKWVDHFNAYDACARCDEKHFVTTGRYLVSKAGEHHTEVAPK